MHRNFDGLIFITNQAIKLSHRAALTKLGADKAKEIDLFHLERLRAILDSPAGYGVRVQFLRIPMNVEEQLSWFSESGSRLDLALEANTRELRELKGAVRRLSVGQEAVQTTLQMVAKAAGAEFVAPLPTQDQLASISFEAQPDRHPVSASLSPALLLAFHRLTCFELPARIVGRFRSSRVKVGRASEYVNESFEPPPPSEVLGLVGTLCSGWNASFLTVLQQPKKGKIEAIASFHARFLAIHPFSDGNGRVARALLMQQCLDFFGKADMSLMNKGGDYYAALQAADRGDLSQLAALITPIVQS